MVDTAQQDVSAALRPSMPAIPEITLAAETAPQDLSGRRLVIVTDAWFPQINGVVRTLDRTCQELEKRGLNVHVIGPNDFVTLPCPTYPEIRLAVSAPFTLARKLEPFMPAAIHIATEGPLGIAARRYCKTHGLPFTTSFHTRFPEYVQARCGLPTRYIYAWLRKFHGDAKATMVTTPTMEADLRAKGFQNLKLWSRGVDLDLFRPQDKMMLDLPRPIFMNVGRIAVEKNICAFLDLPLAGSKVVVGGGPQLEQLRVQYPEVRFVGPKTGQELSRYYAAADVFVFPSETDTFGLVLLEALASGVPVAAYPVPGPIDVITDPACGVLDTDLKRAAEKALRLDPAACRAHAQTFSWERCTDQFIRNANEILTPHAFA